MILLPSIRCCSLSVSFWLNTSAVRIISFWLSWLVLLLALTRWRELGLFLGDALSFVPCWTLVGCYWWLSCSTFSCWSILLPIIQLSWSRLSFLNVTLFQLDIPSIWWLSSMLAFSTCLILIGVKTLLLERVLSLINILRVITLTVVLQAVVV